MTEPEEKAEEESQLNMELEIPFTYPVDGGEQTRNMWVKMPRPEQILVWQRVVKRLTDAPPNATWTSSELLAALERLRKIVDSIVVNKADIAWLDDEMLEGTIGFKELSPLITQAVAAFNDKAATTGSREQRRAATKATKKATRKKAPK